MVVIWGNIKRHTASIGNDSKKKIEPMAHKHIDLIIFNKDTLPFYDACL